MSLSWITERINVTLNRFSNSVEEFKDRAEKVAQEQQRRISNSDQRISNLEQRIRDLEKLFADHHLVNQRKDSAEPQISTPTNSSSGTSPLCARCCSETINQPPQNPLILPSFDELSRGVDPMDMSFEPLSPNEGPSKAWKKEFSRLSCTDGYSNPESGEDSDQEGGRLATSVAHANGQAHHQVHPVNKNNPDTWS